MKTSWLQYGRYTLVQSAKGLTVAIVGERSAGLGLIGQRLEEVGRARPGQSLAPMQTPPPCMPTTTSSTGSPSGARRIQNANGLPSPQRVP